MMKIFLGAISLVPYYRIVKLQIERDCAVFKQVGKYILFKADWYEDGTSSKSLNHGDQIKILLAC